MTFEFLKVVKNINPIILLIIIKRLLKNLKLNGILSTGTGPHTKKNGNFWKYRKFLILS